MAAKLMVYTGNNETFDKIILRYVWDSLPQENKEKYIPLEGKAFEDFIGDEYRVPCLPMDCGKECEFSDSGKEWIIGELEGYSTFNFGFHWKADKVYSYLDTLRHPGDTEEDDEMRSWFIFARIKK